MRYPNGQPIRLSSTVKDVTGTLVNATTLTLTVQNPDLTTQTFASPTNDGTGLYHQDITAANLTQNGHYLYTWVSTGTGAGVATGEFDVYDPFEPVVISLQDAKDALNIPQTTTTYDSKIALMVAAITGDIENLVGGPVYNRSITERIEVLNNWQAVTLRKRLVQSITSITDLYSGMAVSIADVEIDSNSGIVRRKVLLPFLSRGKYYTVVYVAGQGSILPAAFGDAARVMLQHRWLVQRTASQRPMAGLEETILTGTAFGIPQQALEMLDPYMVQAYV